VAAFTESSLGLSTKKPKTFASFLRPTISLVVIICVHRLEDRTKKQLVMRVCGFEREKGSPSECRRSSFVVVFCSAVKFVSIIKSDVVVYISHFFLVEIRGAVFHMRIVQVIFTCSLNK